jgi:hypothetical protein
LRSHPELSGSSFHARALHQGDCDLTLGGRQAVQGSEVLRVCPDLRIGVCDGKRDRRLSLDKKFRLDINGEIKIENGRRSDGRTRERLPEPAALLPQTTPPTGRILARIRRDQQSAVMRPGIARITGKVGSRTSGRVSGLQRGLFSGDNRSRTEPRGDPPGQAARRLASRARSDGPHRLMLLQESRRAARSSPEEDLILLDQQDRSLWNRDQIAEGISFTENALASRRFGAYTLQAAIPAVHADPRRHLLTGARSHCSTTG